MIKIIFIINKIIKQSITKMVNLAIAIVGMTNAGKTEVANFLRSKGFGYVRLGELTELKLNELNLPNNEENNRKVREKLREEYGNDAYAKLNFPNIKQLLKQKDVVIDGMYSWSEYKFFKQNLKNFVTVAVYASPAIRYERARHRLERSTKDYFKNLSPESRDYAEIENIEKGGPIAMADYTINNNVEGIAHLKKELNKFWRWLNGIKTRLG